MVAALFESKEELKVFVLDVIETSPLSGRVDTLTGRVDTLTERVDGLCVRMDTLTERVDTLTGRVDGLCVRMDRVETILLDERARNEERDLKINAIYDVVIAIRDEAAEREKAYKALVKREGATRAKLRDHVENSSIHVGGKRGRPRKTSSPDELG